MTTEQKVGMFFLATLVLLAVMIELVEDWRPFEDSYNYIAYFQTAVGLKVGDPVRIAGVDAGKVTEIGIENQKVRIDFYVNRKDSVKQDTFAQIRQTNMLGGTFLGLDFGTPEGAPLAPGNVVNTKESANIDQLITNLDRNQDRVLKPLGDMVDESRKPLVEAINSLERIVVKIDRGEGSLGLLINNPALYEEIMSMSSKLNQLLAGVEDNEGSLGKLLSDSALYDNLNQTMINLARLTEQLNSGEGTLGKLLKDDRLYEDAADTISNLNQITDKINQGQGALGKLLDDENLYDDIRTSVSQVSEITRKINEGQGTIGRLINDDDLYRDTKTTLHKVEKSVDGISDTGPLSALGVVLGTLF